MIDRLQNIPAEKATLGSIIMDPVILDEIEQILSPDDFFLTGHQEVYRSLLALRDRGEKIDLVTLTTELSNRKQLQAVGGVPYLTKLGRVVASAAAADHHAELVREASIARQILRYADMLRSRTLNGDYDSAEELLTLAEEKVSEIRPNKRGGLQPIRDFILDHISVIENTRIEGGGILGKSWGIAKVDMLTSGACGGQLIIIGARPSVGKTAFALKMARTAGIEEGSDPVAIFSLEMRKGDLLNRMIAAEAKIPLMKIRHNKMSEGEWRLFTQASDKLYRSSISMEDKGRQALTEIVAESRALKRKHGRVGMILIDYLGLIGNKGRGRRNRNVNRDQEIGEYTGTLKELAKELDCPVVLLAQLNRDVEKGVVKRPNLSSLRESGNIEQDADVVAFLHRDDSEEYVNFDTGEPISKVELIIAKNRDGSVGTVPLAFRRVFQDFVDWDQAPGRQMASRMSEGA
ncbi:replicative DNA helicase [Brevibacillus borstelensis AK1]|uniref:Replicative DNA helicase n=1 Tax=Brevibacillus borstelensis AK1 TaxID=1300222 RepID=M8EFK9_9BACL|nr:replicative DNA helicase [Brevibacillus borstelensis]EMT54265.1 replicative DNA helicase [Brevibacillus borstelensis AK1]